MINGEKGQNDLYRRVRVWLYGGGRERQAVVCFRCGPFGGGKSKIGYNRN